MACGYSVAGVATLVSIISRAMPAPRSLLAVWALLVFALLSFVSAGELKVDINRYGSNNDAYTALGYQRWTFASDEKRPFAVFSGNFNTSTDEHVTVTFALTAEAYALNCTHLTYTFVKMSPVPKLVADGMAVAPPVRTQGGQIQMNITGLNPGRHTLLAYHNSGDNPSVVGTVAPINVYVNGVYATSAFPTIRAPVDAFAAITYVSFTVSATTDITTILFAANSSYDATTKNVFLNGFEIDTPPSNRLANSPHPANDDQHVDADQKTVILSWAPAIANTTAFHDVYYGTVSYAVLAANTTSSLYLGRFPADHLSLSVSVPDSFATYYWRVDAIEHDGTAWTGLLWSFRPRHLAFPGAEGYGRFARGGRGGYVAHVTSLADYSADEAPIPGTLRYAVEQLAGPRTIVFDVSGLIELQAKVILTNEDNKVTIAGQTAPGKGICLKTATIGLSGASDVIIRHIRSRPGRTLHNITINTYSNGTTVKTPVVATAALSMDGMGLRGSNHAIIDHCSISWTIDESFSSRDAANITLQNTLISEPMNKALHPKYLRIDNLAGSEHGFCASIGGDIGSFHHNMLAHCKGRAWSLAGGLDGTGFYSGRLDLTNNVVYNWGAHGTEGGAHEVNFVNNYYKAGNSTVFPYVLDAQFDAFPGTQRYYVAGNVSPGRFNESTQTENWAYRKSLDLGKQFPNYTIFLDQPFFPSLVSTQPAREAYKTVLSTAGCNRPLMDDHDERIIREALTGTFTYRGSVTGKAGFPDDHSDVGGWEHYPEVHREAEWDSDADGLPNWWEQIIGLNTHSPAGDLSDTNGDPDGDGYTNLEDYLNWLALPHIFCNMHAYSSITPSCSVNVTSLTRGFDNEPAYSVHSATNGSVSLDSTRTLATFTPAQGFVGLAQFTITVTDAEGSVMHQVVNVAVNSTQGSKTSSSGGAYTGSTGAMLSSSGANGSEDSDSHILLIVLIAVPAVIVIAIGFACAVACFRKAGLKSKEAQNRMAADVAPMAN